MQRRRRSLGSSERFALCLLLAGLCAVPCAAADAPRPSILLIVVDTLRADAVSAYGSVQGTTPRIDTLAREGLLYRNAWAPAPWTLPSHASIFTGLSVAQHRVGMPDQGRLPEELTTLAERLGAEGYETATFSENSVVSEDFGMFQGFDYRVVTEPRADGREIDAPQEVAKWLGSRTPGKPFFVFVNLMNPHQPYEIRASNSFVPPGTPPSAIKTRTAFPNRLICGGIPTPEQIGVLRGLYLGDVNAADAEVDRIVRDVRARGAASSLITLVTSDHGEYFGESRLMGHEFGLHGAVLRVPLIVHGAPRAQSGVVLDTVSLVDLVPSVLSWVGLRSADTLPGRPLPLVTESTTPGDRAVFAAYSDAPHWIPDRWKKIGTPFVLDESRQFCSKTDRVWGGMAAIIQHPFKLNWFERFPAELYDLSWDPQERSNQTRIQPDRAKRMTQGIAPLVRAARLTEDASKQGMALSDEALERLKSLGYVAE